MRLLVLGCRGLVGRHLAESADGRGHARRGLDHDDGGDLRDPARLRASAEIAAGEIGGLDWVVNLAAMTAVDACETDRDTALAANAEGAGNAARVAGDLGARLLQVSTDYVFDGESSIPYAEDAPRRPISVYGESKSAGRLRCAAAQFTAPTTSLT